MKKRILLLAFALCMVLILLPANAHAVEYSGTCGENLTWVFDDATGALTISGTGKMEEFYPSVPWEDLKDQITDVTIGRGVTSIGSRAFSGCAGLTSVTIPDSVTWIGVFAFSDCDSLISITIPDGITMIGDGAFSGCDSLTTVKLPDGVKYIEDSAFSYCTSLTGIELPDSVTSIDQNAFCGCINLTSITIPDSVTYIGDHAFSRCNSLTSVVLPNGVTRFGSAFSDCAGLTSITIPDSITSIETNAFDECTSLTSVTIPDGVTSIEARAFLSCSSLTDVSIPDSVTSIAGQAFQNCTSLTSVTIPGSVTSIGAGAFEDCTSLTSVTISDGVVSIGENAFHGCTGLTNVTIPGSVTSVGASFSGCTGLTSVTILDGVTSIEEWAFEGCESLTSVTIPNSVASIGKAAFHSCTSLTSVTIPDSITSISAGTFNSCERLKNVTIPDSVTSIGSGAFFRCASLETITIPDGVTFIGDEAFRQCFSLTSITIPAGVTNIDERTFSGCDSLREIIFKGDAPAIAYDAFVDVIANVYYPADNDTWTEDKMQKYGGVYVTWVPYDGIKEPTESHTHTWGEGSITAPATCTTEGVKTYTCECGETRTEVIPIIAHYEVIDPAVSATCTADGLTEGKHCSVCNTVLVKQESIPAKGHSFDSGKCTVCGTADPNYVPPTEPIEPEPTEPEPTEPVEETFRVAGGNRFETANLVADQMKENLGIEKFDAVVVASGTEFADALAGSYLAAVKNAPILLSYTTDKINDGVKDYIKANLNPGGIVYILGGTNAVPENFKDGLEAQFTVKRLAGGNRFETNLLVLEEAGVGDKPILVCTGLDFADSLSASATKLPILLVYGDKLLPDQAAFMEANQGRDLYIIGGEGAVSAKLESALTAYGDIERVAGNNRFETSTLIAEKFFTAPESAVLAYAWGFPDGLCGGPLATTMNAPLILTMAKYEAKAADYIQTNAISNAVILGGETLIPESSVHTIFTISE